MTRKKFLKDLELCQREPPAHITNVDRYDSDGISFTYWYMLGGIQREVGLKLITTDVDEYPDGNTFMLFTDDADVDANVTDTLVHIQAIIDGSSVFTALREIAGGLQQALTLGVAETSDDRNGCSKPYHESESDDFDDFDDDDTNFGLDELLPVKQATQIVNKTRDIFNDVNVEIAKVDLRAAKEAGFKIGVHGDLSRSGIVSVAIRITKLGISAEAIQAWGLSRNQYLVLLIRFQRGYRTLVEVMEDPTLTGSVQMRVGLSDTYKPSYDKASGSFTESEDQSRYQSTQQSAPGPRTNGKGNFLPLFIGRPINDLFRERFTKILKFRKQFRLPWGGAERLFNDRQGTLLSDLSRDLSSYQEPENLSSTRALPDLVTADAFSKSETTEASLPLVAMQFLLRHFVRCTEFCLVCHCKVEDTFEALKPYVCSNPLCLYQFLAFGFGPAAEWEIISQPYVVDLLICLCHAQASAARLRELPLGINLKVPLMPHFKIAYPPTGHHPAPALITNDTKRPLEPTKAFKAQLNLDQKVLTAVDNSWETGKQRIMAGDWIVLDPSVGHRSGIYHCRINDDQGTKLTLGTITFCAATTVSKYTDKYTVNQSAVLVDCYVYDANFDELSDQYQYHAISTLLDALPSVRDLRTALLRQQEGHRNSSLNSLRRMCPSASLDLLRWIIASNRSCIMQVDEIIANETDVDQFRPSEDRVSGMDDWMQFRFAQGAPDKEQRFIDCVKKKSSSTEYPTLFAWHGSPLCNWHSIIRQGLNFDEVLHGRANGHGVYMSPHLSTSMGYVGSHHRPSASPWLNSELKISSVISLQEVVNAPNAFVSRSPHLVVAEKDWIQTRYLFVRTNVRHTTGSAAKATYKQDPLYSAKGMNNEPVCVPITAVSRSRRLVQNSSSLLKRKKRKVSEPESTCLEDFDDSISVVTEKDDREALALSPGYDSDDVVMTDVDDVFTDLVHQSSNSTSPSKSKKRSLESRRNFILDSTKTNFVPGTLNTSGIRFMDPPKYASVAATRALMRAFSETIKVQETTPLHDLGFYVDPNRMENMYQWIVELHSFDKSLPLARDMKAAGITSIVFEMLFTSDFPFSPPFVRVVKPRFLDPMSGGGGHITQGGAICMELLTSTGWSAVNSIESVLLQVRLAMSERERPARLLSSHGVYQTTPYGIGEAITAYKRFCDRHGWKIPKELDSLASI